jgi:hypothetical protein
MSFMGQSQPATDTISEQWIADDRFASVSSDQTFIIDGKKNLAYMVFHKSKTYVESALPFDLTKLLPPEAAAMAGMFTMSATVSPTTETKKIGQWNCTGYDVTISIMGMGMKMKAWATTDVPFDIEAFKAKIFGNLLKGQMRLDDNSVKEMMKIKGFQIASETSGDIMGAKMRSTVETLEISKKDAPANVFAPPAGYTKKATLSMEDIRR